MLLFASIIIGFSVGDICGESYGWLAFGVALFARALILVLIELGECED